MTEIDMYNMAILVNAVKDGSKLRSSDVNQIYQTIPDAPPMKAKQGKIKYIMDYFEKISIETIQRYLINKQTKENGRTDE